MNQSTATTFAEAMARSLSRQVTTINGKADEYRAKTTDEKFVDVDAEIREQLEGKP